jgi:hypothetical protein
MPEAHLRFVLCATCHRIARVVVFGTSESATFIRPDIPARHYPDLYGARCHTCAFHTDVDYSLLYTLIPIALSRCIRLSYKAQRWVSVDCESVLSVLHDDDEPYDELAAKVQQHYPEKLLVSGSDLRKIMFT